MLDGEVKMKILYLAFACNPFAGSEAQCGWAWPMVMRKYAEVAVLTRKENRSDIERFLEEKAIKNIKVFYHDIPEWMNFYYKKGKGLPIGNMSSQFLAILYLN